MNTPESESMLLAGTITGAYGIKGWVKVHALTDPVTNFLSFGHWNIQRRKQMEPIEFVDGKLHGKGLIAKIAGIDDRTDAEKLRGLEVWVPEAQLPALEDGELYWHQLEGLRVWCDHEGDRLLLGVVDHMLETGANDVMVLRSCEGSLDDRERLIPFVEGSVVNEVNTDSGEIFVSWHPED